MASSNSNSGEGNTDQGGSFSEPAFHQWRLNREWSGTTEDLTRSPSHLAFEADTVIRKLRKFVLHSYVGGWKSLSDLTELPECPPPEVAGNRSVPLSHPWTYRTIRRLLRLMEATADRPKNSPYVPYITVSKSERDLLFEWRPLLKKHDGFRAFTQYLLHHTFRSEREDKILASYSLVRRNFGLDPDYHGGSDLLPDGARAIELLWLYAAFVDPSIRWTNPHPPSGKARVIRQHGVPDKIREEALDFYLDRKGRDGIVLMTNSPDSHYQRKKNLSGLLEEADQTEPEVELPEATYRVVKYHNEMVQDRGGKQMFTRLADNAQEAVDHLKSGVAQIDSDSVAGVRASIRRVRAFEDLPRPVYKASSYTPRPTSVGSNHLMQIPSEALAEMFTPQYVYLDGSKIQLALFEQLARSMDQECPTIRDYLKGHLDGQFDLWQTIGASIDLPDEDASRDAAKRGTYAALYFSGEDNLYRQISKEYAKSSEQSSDAWPSGEDVDGFFDHPVIEELLEVRESMKQRVESDGEIEDAFGIARSADDFSERSNPERTMLSCILQGHELRLMEPLYEMAIEEQRRDREDRFRIALYKYDGILAWIREGNKQREREKWTRRMQEVFDDRAENVLTRLDVEQVGAPDS